MKMQILDWNSLDAAGRGAQALARPQRRRGR
jgi:hypothetical protein